MSDSIAIAPPPPQPGHAQRVDLALPPREVLRRWPTDIPLASIWAGGSGVGAHRRLTILAAPRETLFHTPTPFSHWPDFLRTTAHEASPDSLPFTTGWIGFISYDAGRLLEPHAQSKPGARDDRHWPAMAWARCDNALVFDHDARAWFAVGNCTRLLARIHAHKHLVIRPLIGELRSTTGRDAFTRDVARVLEYLRAGDAYQVNLAHRLTADFAGRARPIFESLTDAADPWHGGYLEFTHRDRGYCVASASPELFLRFDAASRRVETRPMKGTASAPANTASKPLAPPQAILSSAKDLAELDMIIDLVRNDLSRACDLGSVRVAVRRAIERHAGADGSGSLFQAVATVAGRLRNDASLANLLDGAFPGGSVTGAPKIRAMQIIDELEPVRRGPYCGTLGYVSDSGHACFNIAIRTALISGDPGTDSLDSIAGRFDYSVGAGVVADSDPQAEWEETLQKAGLLRRALGVRVSTAS